MRIEKPNFKYNSTPSFGTVIYHKSLENAPSELRLGLEERKQFLENISKNVLMTVSYRKSLFPWEIGLNFKVRNPSHNRETLVGKIISKLESSFGLSVKTKVTTEQGCSKIRPRAREAVDKLLMGSENCRYKRKESLRNALIKKD